MKILIGCLSMAYLSGSPLYHYELARELKKQGNDVDIISEWQNPVTEIEDPEGHILKDNLIKEGIGILNHNENYKTKYDLMIMSEPQSKTYIERQNCPVINVIHSEYECETPIIHPNIKAYVCIRPSIAMHIYSQHKIPYQMIKVIYNGVDRERFCKKNHEKRDYKLIVAPCTLDKLREKFLNYLIENSNEKNRVRLIGLNCGANLKSSPYAEIVNGTFNIEKEIQNADAVAGILLGRVNLEARSCGIPSYVFDPESLKMQRYYPDELTFDTRHNVKNVAKQFMDLYAKLS